MFVTCAYQGGINVRFLENLACFVFLLPPVLRFALLPYHRRIVNEILKVFNKFSNHLIPKLANTYVPIKWIIPFCFTSAQMKFTIYDKPEGDAKYLFKNATQGGQ